MGDVNEYMTALEAARELGLSKSRIDQFIRDGRLKVAVLVGTVRLLSRADVAAVKAIPRVEGRKPKPPADPLPAKGRRKGKGGS